MISPAHQCDDMQAIYSSHMEQNDRPFLYQKFPFLSTFFAIKPTKGSVGLRHQFTSSSAFTWVVPLFLLSMIELTVSEFN